MNSTLTVATIIPTFNRSHLVTRALNSALQASQPGDEIIVVDDGSRDDTEQVLAGYGDKIRYFKIENCGLASARNYGIRQSKSDLIAFLDDDDEWIPQKLTLQRQIMQTRPDILFCFSNFFSIFPNGKRLNSCVFNWGQRVKSWRAVTGSEPIAYSSVASLPAGISDFDVYFGNIYFHQMLDDYVLPTTLMVRRSANFDPACFIEGKRFLESWAYSSHIAKLGKAAYLDIDAACQHDHDAPRLTDLEEIHHIRARLGVLEDQWGRDGTFLAEHGAAYQNRTDHERTLLIRELIAQFKLAEARAQIPKLYNPPPPILWVLAHSPRLLVIAAFAAKNRVKRLLNRVK